MKHARADYGRIQDPEGKIGATEPVFIVRAHDKCAPGTLRAWADLARMAGADPAMVQRVLQFAVEMESWQFTNGSKVPDMPAS